MGSVRDRLALGPPDSRQIGLTLYSGRWPSRVFGVMAPSLSRLLTCAGLLSALLIAVTSTTLAQGSATLDVTPAGAAPAGSTVTVKWSGPNAPGDYITVVRRARRCPNIWATSPRATACTPVNPVSIVLPAEPGAYEIRYVFSNPRSVLAAVPYEVTAVAAAIDGPASVTPGARFEVCGRAPTTAATGSRSSRPAPRRARTALMSMRESAVLTARPAAEPRNCGRRRSRAATNCATCSKAGS